MKEVKEREEGKEGEKLVYKQKLPKYITNCNGESEVLGAWFAAKVGS